MLKKNGTLWAIAMCCIFVSACSDDSEPLPSADGGQKTDTSRDSSGDLAERDGRLSDGGQDALADGLSPDQGRDGATDMSLDPIALEDFDPTEPGVLHTAFEKAQAAASSLPAGQTATVHLSHVDAVVDDSGTSFPEATTRAWVYVFETGLYDQTTGFPRQVLIGYPGWVVEHRSELDLGYVLKEEATVSIQYDLTQALAVLETNFSHGDGYRILSVSFATKPVPDGEDIGERTLWSFLLNTAQAPTTTYFAGVDAITGEGIYY